MRYNDMEDVKHAVRNGHLSRDAESHAERNGVDSMNKALNDATFARGPLSGKTGSPFKDDPFFNPWVKGGALNRGRRGR